MPELSRRNFLGTAAAVTGAAAVGAALPNASAAAATTQKKPGHPPKPYGDIRDIKHVVVIMQENRSFDHYFGALKGVRGFGDRSTIVLPGGKTVWEQPKTLTAEAETQYPWRLSGAKTWSGATPPSAELGAANYGGTSHGWTDQHGAWYGGLMNGWYYAKGGPTTLGYLDRHDLPFHYALADAYTVGDAYHCSVLSATGPNRTFLWGGTINADHKHGSFTAYDGGDERGKFLPWESYAETLQAAGVSWRVYQCADDYGDNGLEYFNTFAKLDPTQGGTAAPGDVYYDNGVKNVPEPATGLAGNADNLIAAIRADVLGGTLPQVNWVVNNQFFSEHPVTAPSNGAYFLRGVLEALNADPDVFNSTLVIINYDENDGQFDHVPPPVPAPGEADEFVSGTMAAYGVTEPLPVGLGFRVPLILISPWTRGGWVTSEVSDHTSVIQFIEKWTSALGKPAVSPNISDWRRKVCGDLTTAFDFEKPVYGMPDLPETGPLIPETRYTPLPGDNTMPTQEEGTKRARPLPYQPNANLTGFTGAVANLTFSNEAPFVTKASHFSVYNNRAGLPTLAQYPAAFPGQYTVAARSTMSGTGPVGSSADDTAYDITVTGPNRFLRRFVGDVTTAGKDLVVEADYYDGKSTKNPKLKLWLHNNGDTRVTFTITHNNYISGKPQTVKVNAHGKEAWTVNPVKESDGWYDVTVTADNDEGWSQRFVGHLETGEASITG
ncbi:phosphocholine-specific phospholipase C [Microbispora bryophytorum]|uniref:phospholipase C n=1 Tax=Microbispora bryophytorum TaxID=1460882 RepID=A0A8H9H8N0_9ACTN|nr:phospholipase C, phosphocholine-specific [Microbispora bryophytorum]MBD3140859.1 phospholipase C, phosphocholine-specific [Microbispora bryophytorum]TQS00686.1 phospholipase C, phosphocholine-specific [Microbispora bryophytorum]GGO31034.1 phospholipase C, phosphocholine-specific [Microbispora bryophytorum]